MNINTKECCDSCAYCVHENDEFNCIHPMRRQKNADVTKEYSCGHWSDVFNDIEWPYYF